MIHQGFPDIDWLKAQIKNRFEQQRNYVGEKLASKGFPSVIINTPISDHSREGILGPLSVFYNLKGTSACMVEGRVINIPQGYFFVTNNQQTYSLHYDAHQEVETFNIHLGEEFSKNYFMGNVLEQVKAGQFDDFFIRNRLYPADNTFLSLVNKFSTAKAIDDKMLYDSILQELLAYLVGLEQGNKLQMGDLGLKNNVNKQELFKRLTTSLDYLYYNIDHVKSIDELADIACLSKFHYLRLFKAVFKITPYQYIQQLKIKKAKQLLAMNNDDIQQVAFDLGFESTSAFDKFFKRHEGVAPSTFLK